MITVAEAEEIIFSHLQDPGDEFVSFNNSLHRILAEDIYSDRDQPPFDRATMDGIAISYKNFEEGTKRFSITGLQAAGSQPLTITGMNDCIEIMTGAALTATADTIIPYEQIEIEGKFANIISNEIRHGQNIHRQGSDMLKGEIIIRSARKISPQILSILASVGKVSVKVKKNPRIAIISTGDELVPMAEQPAPYQIRTSNSSLIKGCLLSLKIDTDIYHYNDDKETLLSGLSANIETNDILIITGGISMGKLDLIPDVLQELGMKMQFSKVSQKPGKPFLFGTIGEKKTVFAFPGNPVSACLCFYRYFIPWFQKSNGLVVSEQFATLNSTITFKANLTFFALVKLFTDQKSLVIAEPIPGNGSGDFTTLATADAFMELPRERNTFEKGEAFKIWPLIK